MFMLYLPKQLQALRQRENSRIIIYIKSCSYSIIIKFPYLPFHGLVISEIRYNCITTYLQVKLSCNMNCKLLQAIFAFMTWCININGSH